MFFGKGSSRSWTLCALTRRVIKPQPMRMLSHTSCLFATVSLHAFYTRNSEYHHLFLLVTLLSILFHTTQHPTVRQLDTAVAHIAFAFMLLETYSAAMAQQTWLLLFPLAVAALWLLQRPFPAQQNQLHACLHCVSVVGLHAFLLTQPSPNSFRAKLAETHAP